MDENTKRRLIRKYFMGFPKWAIWTALIGLVLFIIGVNSSTEVAVVGLVIVGIGSFAIYSFTQGKATDQQMDKWLAEDFIALAENALNKVGIDKSELIREPLTIHGPVLWGGISGIPSQDMLFKVGKDKRVRFSIYNVSVFLLTQNQILTYETYFNFLKMVSINDRTDEYFYRDVTGLTTVEKSSNYVLPNGEKAVNSKSFILKVNGQIEVDVILYDNALEKFVGGAIPYTEADKNIQALRTVWRDKKGALV
jgi:hypothetical protein